MFHEDWKCVRWGDACRQTVPKARCSDAEWAVSSFVWTKLNEVAFSRCHLRPSADRQSHTEMVSCYGTWTQERPTLFDYSDWMYMCDHRKNLWLSRCTCIIWQISKTTISIEYCCSAGCVYDAPSIARFAYSSVRIVPSPVLIEVYKSTHNSTNCGRLHLGPTTASIKLRVDIAVKL